jgi:hypothetical protein
VRGYKPKHLGPCEWAKHKHCPVIFTWRRNQNQISRRNNCNLLEFVFIRRWKKFINSIILKNSLIGRIYWSTLPLLKLIYYACREYHQYMLLQANSLTYLTMKLHIPYEPNSSQAVKQQWTLCFRVIEQVTMTMLPNHRPKNSEHFTDLVTFWGHRCHTWWFQVRVSIQLQTWTHP